MPVISLIGLACSVLLSVLLIIVGIDKPGSILIGLATTIIAILLDVLRQLRESEKKLLSASGLSQDLLRNRELFAAVSSMTTDYLRVLSAGHRYSVFPDRARRTLSGCKDTLHNLVEGHMTVPPLSEYSFGLKNLNEVTERVKATSYVDAERFWNSVAGEEYFKANVALAKRGVPITRIFIGDRDTLSRFTMIMLRHRNAGMKVLVAPTEELSPDMCEDYLIADDRLVVYLELTLDGMPRSERITINDQEVDRAIAKFDRLSRASHVYEEVFRNPS